MASIRRRVLFAGIALSALGASVVAVTGERGSQHEASARPIAVNPEPEAPTAAERARRVRAIPQPTGKRAPGSGEFVPLIANPQR